MLKTIQSIAIAILMFCLAFNISLASDKDPINQDDVILTISGKFSDENGRDEIKFDLKTLKELPSNSFKTKTIWTEGDIVFKGVSLREFLKQLKIKKGTLKAVALNDYAIEIPIQALLEDEAIIAYEMNGKKMSIRDKGPLWIVYPYDQNKKYQTETYYSRSIWQLHKLAVQP